ncbi:MAG: hypothetical protein ACRDD1_15500 [Planctomycetia bacterium]
MMTRWNGRALTAMVVAVGASAAAARADEPRPSPPLFDGLGGYTRAVTTADPAARKYFDQGLMFLFAFNHDEAVRSFQEAARLDPTFAMAHWGVATANGPHINRPTMTPEQTQAAWTALQRAKANAADGRPVDAALVATLAKRYVEPATAASVDRKTLDAAYATALAEAWKQYPDDADVGALYAEACMDLRPWDLWTADGMPQPGTPAIVATLKAVLAKRPDHPLALHLLIHAVEASPEPGRADDAANRLRDAHPGLGHLTHMPSHLDIRRGRWREAVEANRKAIAADDRYRAAVPRQEFYRLYMAHNHHMLSFAAMMQGRSKLALDTARAMLAAVPNDWTDEPGNAAVVDGFFAVPVEILVRFGRWDDVLREPPPAAKFPAARALHQFARATALAAKGEVVAARAAQRDFRAAVREIPAGAVFGNNTAAAVAAVADDVLEGEILLREGKTAAAVERLEAAAAKEDALRYDEPPDWLQPVRHALGAALMKADRPADAEAAYREDLRRWPENGWSLYGLARSLEGQGKTDEAAAVRERFLNAWKDADVELNSSCLCQPIRE